MTYSTNRVKEIELKRDWFAEHALLFTPLGEQRQACGKWYRFLIYSFKISVIMIFDQILERIQNFHENIISLFP